MPISFWLQGLFGGRWLQGLRRALTFLNSIFSINSNCLSATSAAPSRTFAAVFAVALARRSRWLRRRMHVAQRIAAARGGAARVCGPSTMAPLCSSFVLFVRGSGDASLSRGWCCSCPAERVISKGERCNKPHDSKGQLAAAVKASEEVGRGTMIAQQCEVWRRCELCLQYRA